MKKDIFNQQVKLQLLQLLEENPRLSQRELSREMGVALGKVNFCLTALVEKGCVKLENFKGSTKRIRYAYMLTPDGLEEKLRLTYFFLKRRLSEYSEIKEQINELASDLERDNPDALADLVLPLDLS